MIKGDNRFSTLNKQDRTYFKVKLYLVFQKFKKKLLERQTHRQERKIRHFGHHTFQMRPKKGSWLKSDFTVCLCPFLKISTRSLTIIEIKWKIIKIGQGPQFECHRKYKSLKRIREAIKKKCVNKENVLKGGRGSI